MCRRHMFEGVWGGVLKCTPILINFFYLLLIISYRLLEVNKRSFYFPCPQSLGLIYSKIDDPSRSEKPLYSVQSAFSTPYSGLVVLLERNSDSHVIRTKVIFSFGLFSRDNGELILYNTRDEH